MQLFFIFLLVIVWWCVEFYFDSSNGIVSTAFGCLILGFGMVNLTEYDKILSAAVVAVGLFIALIGIARFVLHEIKDSNS